MLWVQDSNVCLIAKEIHLLLYSKALRTLFAIATRIASYAVGRGN